MGRKEKDKKGEIEEGMEVRKRERGWGARVVNGKSGQRSRQWIDNWIVING